MDIDFFLRGLIIGFSIAAPVGPIGVLCIRRTLAGGRAIGFVSGLGAATADSVYGAIAGFGLTAISGFLVDQQTWFRLIGGAFLIYLGVKTFRSRPAEQAAAARGNGGLVGAYLSTLALTLTNPATILSFVAIFAGLGIAESGANYGSALVLVAGVFGGSAVWWLILSGGVSLFRAKFTPARLRYVNWFSGAILAGFGLLAVISLVGLRTARRCYTVATTKGTPVPNDLFAHLDDLIARYRDEQIAFLQALVRTRSANPFIPDTSDPDEPIERAVAYLIHDKLREIGLSPEFKSVSPDRPNVVATLRGTGSKRALILNGHMDTVMPSPLWTMNPFGGDIRDGRLYGLGALDMKASLSVFVYAAKALIELGVSLAGDLILTFVVDEEPGGCSRFGSSYLLANGITGTAAIVGEPETANVTIGHRGGYRFRLVTHGEATHTGLEAWERGEKGKNAITDMARAITALQGLALPFDETPAFPGRRPVLTFPTMIEGGVSINAVPDRCIAYGDVRLLPGCDVETVERLIRAQLDALPALDYALERLLFVPAVEIAPDEKIVSVLVNHTAAITGQTPTTLGCGPWNDGWMFITRGIPAVCGFGPNGAGVHGPDEHVELDSVIAATRIYTRAVIDYLGVTK